MMYTVTLPIKVTSLKNVNKIMKDIMRGRGKP